MSLLQKAKPFPERMLLNDCQKRSNGGRKRQTHQFNHNSKNQFNNHGKQKDHSYQEKEEEYPEQQEVPEENLMENI